MTSVRPTRQRTDLIRRSTPLPHVALLTIDSPPRNAFGVEESRQMGAALDWAESDPEIRCVVITGTGSSFTAGANLREQLALGPDDLENYVDSTDGMTYLVQRIEDSSLPVIAAVNGFALGGGLELALACDIRVASTEARFVCSAVNVGLILSWHRLPRLIGLGPAKEMLLSGQMYDATKAEHWGLVTAVHPPEVLMERTLELAAQVASRAPLSVAATKNAADQAFEISESEAAARQRELFLTMARTQDHEEAIRAFLEKRPAHYQGR
jgi:enoyl-CoA hydratase